MNIEILKGQTYMVANDWPVIGSNGPIVSVSTLLNVIEVENRIARGQHVITNIPKTIRPWPNWMSDLKGNAKWGMFHFQQSIKDGILRLIVENDKIESEGLTNNGMNEICYWCGCPTDPMFGRMRICRRCKR